MEEQLPIKTKAKPPRPEHRLMALIEGQDEHAGKVLIRQRPATGLLARMWELPHVLASDAQKAGAGSELSESAAMERLSHVLHNEGIDVQPTEMWNTAEHTFSHIQWYMRVFRCTEAGRIDAPVDGENKSAEQNGNSSDRHHLPIGASSKAVDHPAAKKSPPSNQQVEQGTLDLKMSGSTPESLDKIRQQLASSAVADTLEPMEQVAEQPETYEAVPPTLLGESFAYDYRWIGREDMEKYAFPNLFLKILEQYFEIKK